MPLDEYPRPNLVRGSYYSLNGTWHYAIQNNKEIPDEFKNIVEVPYAVEWKNSGVEKPLKPGQYLLYQKVFTLDSSFVIKDKVLLHFLAVDQTAEVYLNHHFVTAHEGGYLPFEADIKPYLKEKDNVLVVIVEDKTDYSYYSRGKQTLFPKGIWYKAASGIYLPVWIESASNDYIQEIHITPDVDHASVTIEAVSIEDNLILDFGNKHYEMKDHSLTLTIPNPSLWSPENPHLYPFSIHNDHDKVDSYFALRKISVKEENGVKRICLNNQPYFMKGLLDQGYYQDSGLTPKSYEDYRKDILFAKSLGFNTLRKHIKIESPVFYYECDRLGMLVWQDFISGSSFYKAGIITLPLITDIHLKDHHYNLFKRKDDKGREFFLEEAKGILHYLSNHPSIVLWTIFNEGWGQFDAASIYQELKNLDRTRLFDHASGWHDQGVSDVKSLHVYLKKVKMPGKKKTRNRAIILSECGGYVYKLGNENDRGILYRSYPSAEALEARYQKLIREDILPNIPKGLCAFIYTQLSDVEGECNGFISYDRSRIKIHPETIRKINDAVTYQDFKLGKES